MPIKVTFSDKTVYVAAFINEGTEFLVTQLPPREWIGLTDEEIKEIIGPWGPDEIKGFTRKLFDEIEAKLKEKNHDQIQNT